MAGFENDVVYAENVDFRGVDPVQGQVTTNGQLLIGSTVAPYIRVGSLASSGGTIAISTGAGTINLEAAASVPTTFNSDSGSATPAANALTLAGGSNGIDTTASGSTVTFNFDVTETSCVTSMPTSSGTATPSSNAITIVGSGTVSTSASGSTITIAGTGGGMTWTEVTGTSQSMAVGSGYVANNAGLVTLTLPTTAAFGDIMRVSGKGAGLFKLAQNSGQTVRIAGTSTTTGVGGSLTAIERYDSLEILCITANTDFEIISSVGNFTVV